MSTLHTIVFYSYKGGVGRSLALYHLTKHLAQQGKKVVLMDLDLEAPGLPFKFNLREQIPGGMVDLLDDFAKHEKNPEDRLYELMVQPRFAEQDRVEWQGFAPVRLLAAGNPLDLGYWKRLAQLNWQDMFYSEPRWGVGFFLEVKEIIRDKYDPDYLLIDARTGITEMGGAALALLADQVVCLFVNNMENHYGIRSVMRGIRTVIRPPGAEPISIIPVVTRIPERMLSEDQLTSELQEFFNKPAENLAATLNIHQVFVLHSHPPLEIDESQAIDEKAALFLDYKKLFQVLRPPEPTIHKKYTSPPLERPIRWLHLSDLHMGSPGRTLWWQVHEEFKTSILAAVEQSGPPDCILITGDLTWRGQASDFHLLDQFLAELLGWLRKEGREDPLIIPVPGNHDLSRPKGMATLPYSVLEKFGKGRDDPAIALLLDTLWEEKDASYLAPLFANYQEWLERTILPVLRQRKGVSCVTSHFPGDLLVHLNLPGKIPLSVVGLNSAWLFLTDGSARGRLEIATEQLQTLLRPGPEGGSPLRQLENRAALLLMHHPPEWLSDEARSRFFETIYTPERFLACLYGHMHNLRSETTAFSGSRVRCYLQGASLFGLEKFGTRQESRRMGYAWGEIQISNTVKLWPLKRELRGDGSAEFLHDVSFGKEDPRGILIRPLAQGAQPPPEAVDLSPWLRTLLDRVDHINLMGISSGVGRGKNANRYPVEHLFTTLRSRSGKEENEHLSLAELFPRHPRLLLEGQPGAGKSTFLHLAATMLARDVLGMDCPDASSWRKRFLGLDDSGTPPLPLLLRLSELANDLSKGQSQAADNRFRLLDLLDHDSDAMGSDVWRNHWENLLKRGDVVLLLDGLDEVTDDRLRNRVFAIVQNALRHWDKTRVVLTSRPFGVELMAGMGFHHGIIEPFGKEEIREFLDRWIACFHHLPVGAPPGGEAGRYGDLLGKAILDNSAIRRMATNPVMLTCLCVIHWNEGRLPEGRSRVYLAVIRWLIEARTLLRKEADFSNGFADRAFSRLALAMMGGKSGKKQATWDLDGAARAVEPLVARDFPGLSTEERLHKGREWLRSECLFSGIIEEVGQGRIRFWHLTFQEFLAARQLAWMEEWWPRVQDRLDDMQWRETIDLFPGCLLEGGQGQVDRLLKHVLDLRGENPSLDTDARVAGIMGRLLAPLPAFEYKPTLEVEKVYRDVLERTLGIFTKEGAAKVPIETRIAAAEALGRGGDPRLNRNNFIEVPGTGWKLGKYLVTVYEFQQFVEHEGYGEPHWWCNAGWTLAKEKSWENPNNWDSQTQHPNRPVTGVSWFEAMAYCRWLSAQRNETIRLPCTTLWQISAQSPRCKYPWGDDDPTPELANYMESEIDEPTPVGLYPAGDGPLGHCDLAGNVWEWCRNSGLAETLNLESTPLDPIIPRDNVQAFIGGSWANPAKASCDLLLGTAFVQTRDIGFRVAAAPASR